MINLRQEIRRIIKEEMSRNKSSLREGVGMVSESSAEYDVLNAAVGQIADVKGVISVGSSDLGYSNDGDISVSLRSVDTELTSNGVELPLSFYYSINDYKRMVTKLLKKMGITVTYIESPRKKYWVEQQFGMPVKKSAYSTNVMKIGVRI